MGQEGVRRGVDIVVGELTVGVTGGAADVILFSSSGLESPLDQSSDIVRATNIDSQSHHQEYSEKKTEQRI